MVLTLILWRATSIESVFAKPITPAQVATESPKPAIGWIAEIAVMLRMLPPPRRSRCGSAPRAMRIAYIRFCSTAFCQAASSKEAAGPRGGVTVTSLVSSKVCGCWPGPGLLWTGNPAGRVNGSGPTASAARVPAAPMPGRGR